MKTYTIDLTDAEDISLGYVAVSQAEWINNVVKERSRIAMDEIIIVALQKSIETNTPLPTSKEEIVMMAVKNQWIKLAVDKQKDEESQIKI